VSFHPQSDFETLFASVSNEAQLHLPPKSWLQTPDQSDPSTTEPIVRLLCNGRRIPDRTEFFVRAKELSFKNEDAFSNLTRKVKDDRVTLRLAHFRKFWEGLDNLAYYWDTSIDKYLPPKPNGSSKDDSGATVSLTRRDGDEAGALSTSTSSNADDKGELDTSSRLESGATETEPRKKAKLEVSSNETVSQYLSSTDSKKLEEPTSLPSISSSRSLPARMAPPKVPNRTSSQLPTQKPTDLSKGSYTGYRIGNGAEMPDQYRLDCVRGFLEPITWVFGVTLAPHRRPPVLLLERMRFPVRMSSVVWRPPQDRRKARQGCMEGPLMGIQCRSGTNFGSSGDLQAESILDTTRELGGLLLLAQERAREGRVESRGGEGKWWATRHRWGGGPGGEVGEATGAPEMASEETAPKADEKVPEGLQLGSRDRRRRSPAETWKMIRPNLPLWDPKVAYEAIGKDRNAEWDDASSHCVSLELLLTDV
jgi:hypothetical protein